MFARWAKMSKAFTKLGREIAIAVRLGGPNPAANSRLRIAVQNARAANMPKDRIENAIKKASAKDATMMDEVTYEGYGPHGVALFIETATDNPTRTVANVRNVIGKHGGNLTTNGALDFVFTRRGVFTIAKPDGDIDELELELIDHGLEDLFESESGDLLIYTSFNAFGDVQKYLESKHIEVKSAGLQRFPNTFVELGEEDRKELLKMVDMLEDDDDVQVVYHNLKHDD